MSLVKLLFKVVLDTVPHVLPALVAVSPSRLEDAPLFLWAVLLDKGRSLLVKTVLVFVAGVDLLLASKGATWSLGRPRFLHTGRARRDGAPAGRAAGRAAKGIGTAAVTAVVCAGPSDIVEVRVRQQGRCVSAVHVTKVRLHGHVTSVAHHHVGALVCHLERHIEGLRPLVVHRVRVWAFRHAEGPIVRLRWRVGRAAAFIRSHVEIRCYRHLVVHGRGVLRALGVHVELAVPLLVIHLGAAGRRRDLGIGGARGRRILRCQLADLVERGRVGGRDGSEKARVARRGNVERGHLGGEKKINCELGNQCMQNTKGWEDEKERCDSEQLSFLKGHRAWGSMSSWLLLGRGKDAHSQLTAEKGATSG